MSSHNDTKLSWSDADLADAVHHAKEGGMAHAQQQISDAIALRLAHAIGRLHETRVDNKRYAAVIAERDALQTAYTLAQQPITIDSLDDCNC